MSHNTFGHLFRFTTWGESHGLALGCVVDGCPPGLAISEAEIQSYLDKRKPGQSKYTTQRREPDQVKVLSGVMPQEDGSWLTTGTPISMMIENTDQRSKDYTDIAKRYRPGHADFTYDAKYGIRDYRGGGRSSARETAARVAAGAIARKVVPGVTIRGALVQIGPHKVDRSRWNWEEVGNNPFFCPDPVMAETWATELDKILTVFTDVSVDFTGTVRPGDRVTTRGSVVFWRRRKLKAKVELALDDGTVVCSGELSGMGVLR